MHKAMKMVYDPVLSDVVRDGFDATAQSFVANLVDVTVVAVALPAGSQATV